MVKVEKNKMAKQTISLKVNFMKTWNDSNKLLHSTKGISKWYMRFFSISNNTDWDISCIKKHPQKNEPIKTSKYWKIIFIFSRRGTPLNAFFKRPPPYLSFYFDNMKEFKKILLDKNVTFYQARQLF